MMGNRLFSTLIPVFVLLIGLTCWFSCSENFIPYDSATKMYGTHYITGQVNAPGGNIIASDESIMKKLLLREAFALTSGQFPVSGAHVSLHHWSENGSGPYIGSGETDGRGYFELITDEDGFIEDPTDYIIVSFQKTDKINNLKRFATGDTDQVIDMVSNAVIEIFFSRINYSLKNGSFAGLTKKLSQADIQQWTDWVYALPVDCTGLDTVACKALFRKTIIGSWYNTQIPRPDIAGDPEDPGDDPLPFIPVPVLKLEYEYEVCTDTAGNEYTCGIIIFLTATVLLSTDDSPYTPDESFDVIFNDDPYCADNHPEPPEYCLNGEDGDKASRVTFVPKDSLGNPLGPGYQKSKNLEDPKDNRSKTVKVKIEWDSTYQPPYKVTGCIFSDQELGFPASELSIVLD